LAVGFTDAVVEIRLRHGGLEHRDEVVQINRLLYEGKSSSVEGFFFASTLNAGDQYDWNLGPTLAHLHRKSASPSMPVMRISEMTAWYSFSLRNESAV
jgi:hypothetical protein